MADLIDREKLRDEILHDPDYDNDTVNHFLGVVDTAPAVDAVEVVRCGNCEWHNTIMCICQDESMGTEDYCSQGKRKVRESDGM